MKRFCLFVTLYLFVFAIPTFALEVTPEGSGPSLLDVLGVGEASSSSEEALKETQPPAVDFELPQSRLTPLSPFYFLKTLWENVCWFTRRSPEERAFLALELAERRLSEALEVSSKKENVSLVERLFRERETLLKQAWEQVGRLAGDEAQKEKIKREILRQLALGGEVLLEMKATLSDEDTLRVDNLSTWRDTWVVKLEEGLGPRAEFSEATPEAGKAQGVSFFESICNFLLGPRRTLLSPLAAPEGD